MSTVSRMLGRWRPDCGCLKRGKGSRGHERDTRRRKRIEQRAVRQEIANEDVEVIHLTAAEYEQAVQNTLNDLGLPYEELEEQARTDDFMSLRARKIWLMIGRRP